MIKTFSVVYYKYFIRKTDNQVIYRHDIRELIKHFTYSNDKNTKSSLVGKDNEKYYLLPFGNQPNYYYFISTRSNDIAKIIETSQDDIKIDDVEEILKNSSELGFSSYLYIDRYYLALSNSVVSPKSTRLNHFINMLFRVKHISESLEFILESFPVSIDKQQALRMNTIGKTIIKVNNKNTFFDKIKSVFCFGSDEWSDLGSIEIAFVPKKNKNIDKAIKGVLRDSNEEFEKFIIRAKVEAEDLLKDYYIVNSTKAKDTLSFSSETTIPNEMKQKINTNSYLQKELAVIENSRDDKECQDLIKMNDKTFWNI